MSRLIFCIITLLLCLFWYSAYAQSNIIIVKEDYNYQIVDLDNYTATIAIEGINLSDKSSSISFPFSELSTLERSEAFELKKEKWKRSGIDKTVTVSSIDYSSFFSGYKYLRHEIPAMTHFKLELNFKSEHTVFLTELTEKGRFGLTSNVHYTFDLPENCVMSTDQGDELKGKIEINDAMWDTTGVISFLIHPKGTTPEAYFSSWFSARIHPQLEMDEAIIPASLKKLKETVNDSTFAAGCFDFVKREIRYVDIENGINAIIPRKCEKTLANQLGDCKDMATLLTAIYRHFGYEAYVAISRTNSSAQELNFPSIGLANHMICVLKLKDEWYYLDPTENGCLFGDPSLQIFGTEAFLIDNQPDYFHSVPTVPRHPSHGKIAYTINEKTEMISLTLNATGKMNFLFQHIRTNYNAPKDKVERLLLNVTKNDWRVDSLTIDDHTTFIEFSTRLTSSMRSKLSSQSLYNLAAFMLPMESMLALFQSNETALYDSKILVELNLNGAFDVEPFSKSPFFNTVEKNKVIFECTLKHNSSPNRQDADSTYLSWNQLLQNTIIVNHEE